MTQTCWTSRWTVSRPADLTWRDWGELGAVYDDGSGSTHLIDALSIELLSLLSSGPVDRAAPGRSIAELVELLDDALPEDMAPDIAAVFFERQLLALQNLALVEQVPADA